MNAASYLVGAPVMQARSSARQTAIRTVETGLNQMAALMLLILLSPLCLMVVGIIVWIDSSPILFAHYRVGRDGRLFPCLKFRTMYVDAERMLAELLLNDPAARTEWLRDQKLSNDPRITPIGHFLRKTSLDELPQLLNVLRGEMNLVGPRPITVSELTRYGGDRWHYLCVRPGMTGMWQVSGRNRTTYAERVALDRWYVEKRTLLLDMKILVKTVRVVLLRDGAQ